ncbi:four-carbon acid sugar kinase family protein, partial [Paracraurococcus ruber]
MAPRVLVVADDLSGAADCAIAWAASGLPAVVALDAAAAEPSPVLAVDTDSRRLAPDRAAAAVRAAVARHAGPGCGLLYKKIDSTLRGPVGAEVAAAAGAERLVIAAPAFPAAGRALRNGRLLVHGTPLEATPLWRAEGAGQDPDLAAMLELAGLPAAVASLEAVRGDLPSWIVARRRDGMRALVCDAAEEADLAAIARAGLGVAAPLLWVG